MGIYTDKRGKEKTVVACGDFTEGGKADRVCPIKKPCIDNSEQNGYGTELSSILEAIEEQTLLPSGMLREFFGICS